MSPYKDAGAVVVTAFSSDEKAAITHSKIIAGGGVFIPPLQYEPPAHYLNKNDKGMAVVRELDMLRRTSALGHFSPEDHANTFQCLENTRTVEGCFMEIGVYKGDGARASLRYMNSAGIKRKVWLLDTYEGFSYDAAKSSVDQQWVGTHNDGPIDLVKANLAEYVGNLDVEFVKMDVCKDELPSSTGPIAVCNIDVDMYEAVKYALAKVHPRIPRRGIIIAEDIGHTPGLGGAELALREFLETADGHKYMPFYMHSGQTLLVKLDA
ncbi:MAG: hypothetical protein EOP06_28395 [Proteobacteria bacterium]|nr:MAG: hypothetical protein EOP06_28395 [Pseudomonadota bacterium]